jgi:ATP-dependent exoDNAse (exonuclease V) beta subunit
MAKAAVGAVSWKAEDYCSSQILEGTRLDLPRHDCLGLLKPGDPRQRTGHIGLSFPTGFSALFSWISSTWPGSDLCAEYPVSATMDNGQRVVGRIDLLIRTADGLVVMDHKLAGSSDGKVEEIVATWAPQLAEYATAIARVSGKPPVGTWLNLPLEGSAVRVMGAV